SWVSNYTLYNVAGIRLNIAKSWRLNQHPTLKGGIHETPFRRMCLCCRLVDWWRDRRTRSEQNFRAQDRTLGAPIASAAEGAGGMGRLGRESFRRHHQI